jgi:ATP-dependent Clp protease ATP-binding subunit ClpB
MADTANNAWPRWLREVDQALSAKPQFVLSGNVRDRHFVPTADGAEEKTTSGALWELLKQRGFEFLVVCDTVGGFAVFPSDGGYAQLRKRLPGFRLPEAMPRRALPEQIPDWINEISCTREVPVALVIDYASRLVPNPATLDKPVHDFFAGCLRAAHSAEELRVPRQGNPPTYNTVFWLVDNVHDLPSWFLVGNDRIRNITLTLPDRQVRSTAAAKIAKRFKGTASRGPDRFAELLEQFVDLTDGMRIRDMKDISALALRHDVDFSKIADAVRVYKVGVPDNPWQQPHLRDQIRKGNAKISETIKGQPVAIQKALDILTRSVMGLTGAQAARTGNRPRGVLFFAGPTGVGKTELAKSITSLLFNDEQAYLRFDMSEFSSEHSEARLIGAPPGYIGHDAGGELVNAIRRKPFSVLLFDEIEKAHPRILDKFLQILEDGRLTDGRGDTVFFSEAVLVFTSNLGMFREDEEIVQGQVMRRRTLRFDPQDPPNYDRIQVEVRQAIDDHFRFRLERPELLNRIGDNIVVFDFIRHQVALAIFNRMVENIEARVAAEHGITLDLSTEARSSLVKECCADLAHGGRGIGNRLETTLINPLARALFEREERGGSRVRIMGVSKVDNVYRLELA